MKIAIIALAVVLALASSIANAQAFQGSGHHHSGAWRSRAVALQQDGPSAAEQAWFRRASRSWGGGGF